MSPGLSPTDRKNIRLFANRWPGYTVIMVGILVLGATIYWSTKAVAESTSKAAADLSDYVKKSDLEQLRTDLKDGFRDTNRRIDEVLLRLPTK